MLKYSNLRNTIAPVHSDFAEQVTVQLEKMVRQIISRANELASRAGRKAVQAHDVARAAVPFAVAQDGTRRLSSQVGGALPNYDGFCDGHLGQCGVFRHATCVFSGGRSRGLRSQKRRSIRRTNRSEKTVGGTFDYAGFCDDHLSQCAWADGVPGKGMPKQCGAGRKARRAGYHKHKKTEGGTFDYAGFCDDHLSQCAWADGGPGRGMPKQCGAGRKARRAHRSQRKTKGGTTNDSNHATKNQSTEEASTYSGGCNSRMQNTRVIHHGAIQASAMNTHNVRWTAQALRLLDRMCQSHLQGHRDERKVT